MEKDETPENSCSMAWWKSIWKMKVPNKMKFFLWRACKGIFPCQWELARQKVAKMPCARLVGRGQETIVHMIWDFGVVKRMWEELILFGKINIIWRGDCFKELILWSQRVSR